MITRRALKNHSLTRILTNLRQRRICLRQKKPNFHEFITSEIRDNSIKIRVNSCQKNFLKDLTRILSLFVVTASILMATSLKAEEFDIEKAIPFWQEKYNSVNDYTAIMHLQVAGDGKLEETECVLIKFQKPQKLYLKWIGKEHEGREVLFVEGAYKNKVVIHPAGLWGILFSALEFDQDSSVIKKKSRHPITHISLGFFISKYLSDYKLGIEKGDVALTYKGRTEAQGRKTYVIESKQIRENRKDYYCYRTLVYVDEALGLPIGFESFDWENKPLDAWFLKDLRLNPGLSPRDFDRKNKAYHF